MKKEVKKVCEYCGKEYTVVCNGISRSKACPECRRKLIKKGASNAGKATKARNELRRKSGVVQKRGTHYGSVTSPEHISSAKEKPLCVSDVRWRIELRRRANPEYYRSFGCDCK